ncbi:hypothetical protein GPY51_20620 [Photorhabdus laumondii subsp. laumondii]|uniref:Transposase n=2 Tax=Photorhabdus TaxID=29487 RepID=A0AAW6BS82_9GAMM|nr:MULTISPECIES: transposase [Photorhabdus]AXG43753.1 hypothetical protein PluDJC_16820 [Photorhabdus laumondii subsp. laumondii]AXG48303.1 hypothetical protein PluTT01m_16970 [Photorhabdus laumondii subsp. laumondii]MCC8384594.1 hypothetical protein [Photorhabdus laumondii]MCC8388950.1 hypothetical protein [Photorhabdus laumondii]MCC8413311.1 hypothetical protein [Photorhabdus laumondii]
MAFIDSTRIAVCHNLRRVFDDVVSRGKSSTGWFYGFKLLLVIHDCREFLEVKLIPVIRMIVNRSNSE